LNKAMQEKHSAGSQSATVRFRMATAMLSTATSVKKIRIVRLSVMRGERNYAE
jgi:hypothetical protein